MTEIVKGTLQPKKYRISWEIKRFFADCQKVREGYRSPIFPIQYPNVNIKWHLQVYPKGLNENHKDFISLLLYSSSQTDIEVEFEFSLANDAYTSKSTQIFKNNLDNWGFLKFRSIDFVKDTKNKILVDDTLTILCEINFLTPSQTDTESFDVYSKFLYPIERQFGDYEQLFESGSFADAMFNLQDKKINVHKAILSRWSPVFKAMFEHDMKEKEQNSVNVTDIDYEVMQELFRFIYSGKVKNIEKIARDLLIAADKYQVIELKALCEKTLREMLTVDNAVEYLTLTDMCDTIHLKNQVVQFVTIHCKDVVKKPGFADLPSKLMYQIILAGLAKD